MTERTANLRRFVLEEIEQFHAGQIDRISSLVELCQKFGYSEAGNGGSIAKVLRKAGLSEERKKVRESITKAAMDIDLVTPSRDWAWMLAFLAVGGYVDENDGEVVVQSKHPQLIEAFRERGEVLFRMNSQKRTRILGGREYGEVEFNNTALGRYIGNLNRTTWPETIREKHSWILDDPKYTWGFIEGLFEKSGNLSTRPEYRDLRILTSYRNIANFITHILTLAGVENPSIVARRELPEGICGVSVHHVADIKLIASNIHSVIPEKEKKLEFFRQLVLPQAKTPENLIKEWIRIKKILGRIPSSTDVRKFRESGEGLFDVRVYRRFGDGSFTKAREVLEGMVTNA